MITEDMFQQAKLTGDNKMIQSYAEQSLEQLNKLKDMILVQENSANYDEYMRGLYNGMEFARCVIEGNDPLYLEARKTIAKEL